jgi:1,4-dihydroxy-2-naphthoyl-CoA synthase
MIIGYKKARELLYLGDQIDAKTALDLGMVILARGHDLKGRSVPAFFSKNPN